jgi:hypothetical protein
MNAIPLCVSPHHTALQTALILRGMMRPEDAAEQARFSRLAATGRDAEARAILRQSERMARLHIANREWAIREQAI